MNVTLRRSIAAAAAVLAAPMLASCAFTAQTDQTYTPTIGVTNRSGAVDVVDALVVSKGAGSGTLVAGLVNNNQNQPDTLTGVTGAKSDASITVQRSGAQVTIPPAGLYQLADKGNIKVYGKQIRPGFFVWVTFNFQNAKSITLQVPVTTPYNGLQRVPLPSSTVPTMAPLPSPSPTHKKHHHKHS